MTERENRETRFALYAIHAMQALIAKAPLADRDVDGPEAVGQMRTDIVDSAFGNEEEMDYQ